MNPGFPEFQIHTPFARALHGFCRDRAGWCVGFPERFSSCYAPAWRPRNSFLFPRLQSLDRSGTCAAARGWRARRHVNALAECARPHAKRCAAAREPSREICPAARERFLERRARSCSLHLCSCAAVKRPGQCEKRPEVHGRSSTFSVLAPGRWERELTGGRAHFRGANKPAPDAWGRGLATDGRFDFQPVQGGARLLAGSRITGAADGLGCSGPGSAPGATQDYTLSGGRPAAAERICPGR